MRADAPGDLNLRSVESETVISRPTSVEIAVIPYVVQQQLLAAKGQLLVSPANKLATYRRWCSHGMRRRRKGGLHSRHDEEATREVELGLESRSQAVIPGN